MMFDCYLLYLLLDGAAVDLCLSAAFNLRHPLWYDVVLLGSTPIGIGVLSSTLYCCTRLQADVYCAVMLSRWHATAMHP